MDVLFLLAIAVVVVLAIVFVQLYGKRKLSSFEVQNSPNEAVQEVNPRRRALAANRNARVRQRIHQEDENEEEETPAFELPGGKIGAKKLAKLQAKAEKKAEREKQEKLQQEKKKAQELAEEERKKLELQEKEEEKKREEQERKIREEKEKQEYEEYLKLKESFSVQEEGWEESGEDETQLQDFINYIKANKIVILEDLAGQFKLKTQDIISRIKNLQADNQLTGVIDDRGKFIYISQEELEAVAKFVKQRGRVSIAELVENSNMLINLTPIVAVTE